MLLNSDSGELLHVAHGTS